MNEIVAHLSTARGWVRGLLSATITGFSSSALASLGVSASNTVGVSVPQLSLRQLAVIAVTGGVVGALAYLKQSPLPPEPADHNPPAALLLALLIPFGLAGCQTPQVTQADLSKTEAWVTANVLPGLPGVIAGGVVITAQSLIKDDAERQAAAAECYAIARLVRSTMGGRLPDSSEFRAAIESAGGGGPFLDFAALADMAGGYVNPYLDKLRGDDNVRFATAFLEAVASGFEKGAGIILKGK